MISRFKNRLFMLQFLQTLSSVCVFKTKPQDVPLRLSHLFIVPLSIVVLAWFGADIYTDQPNNLQRSLLYPVIYAAWLWLLLFFFKKQARWLQCVTVLFGCMSLINAVVYLLLYVLNTTKTQVIDLASPPFLIIAANFWIFILIAYVLKEALDVRWLLAVVITFCSEIVVSILLISLLGY